MSFTSSLIRMARYFGLAHEPVDLIHNCPPIDFAEPEPAAQPEPDSSYYAINAVTHEFVQQFGVDLAHRARTKRFVNVAAVCGLLAAYLYPFAPVG